MHSTSTAAQDCTFLDFQKAGDRGVCSDLKRQNGGRQEQWFLCIAFSGTNLPKEINSPFFRTLASTFVQIRVQSQRIKKNLLWNFKKGDLIDKKGQPH